ncbi:leucokinin [Drosophila albomicans]|uniref:Leucokinin n=1 Tax=Drosophila albomicans TaxID=7291 RepID=A0A6P8WVR3_DROAB|nr:leucokinin [Drosophila albomicans]
MCQLPAQLLIANLRVHAIFPIVSSVFQRGLIPAKRLRMLQIWRVLLLLAICRQSYALPTNPSTDQQLNTCELQLAKYRKFILQAILSFEDVCDAYNARPVTPEDGAMSDAWLFHQYAPPPTSQRGEIWAFFKLLMAQFNDVEFATIIRDAVIERCRFKLQRDDKRNSVVLGKKQRFHSWGGKRSQDSQGFPETVAIVSGAAGMDHNYY